jgi:hypothetical protein
MSDEKKAFLLRIDKKLYDQYLKWSDDELRSINSQIEYILKSALKQAGRDIDLAKENERLKKLLANSAKNKT